MSGFWIIKHPVAKKSYRCEMCARYINRGEKYLRGWGKHYYDDSPHGWIECAHCESFRLLFDVGDLDDGYCWDSYAEFEPDTRIERLWHARWKTRWRDYWGYLYPVPSSKFVAAAPKRWL